MTEPIPDNLSWGEKVTALRRVGEFRPKFVLVLLMTGVLAALFEGIGMSFILPIVTITQGRVDPDTASGVLKLFMTAYDILTVPFTLAYLVAGITVVLLIRYTLSFLVAWGRTYLVNHYLRHIQSEAFTATVGAEIGYFDGEGSDQILNAIVTQAEYAAQAIKFTVDLVEHVVFTVIYATIALVIAPMLTIATGIALALVALLFREGMSTGYSLGDDVADANEEIQRVAQTGTQGIRSLRLFGMEEEVKSNFDEAVTKYTTQRVKIVRNTEFINKYYNLTTAITIFVLIYVGLVVLSISLASLGLFLFAIFRLGPRVSNLNSTFYSLEGNLPHLVRTQQFIDELEQHREINEEGKDVPNSIDRITFDEVRFSYGSSEEKALHDVTFTVSSDEFVGIVGPSGAGKSSITSLLARFYSPDSGEIRANGTPIHHFDPHEWRSRIAVVRQSPYIFNTTLRENIRLGRRDVGDEAIEQVCTIAQVTEFLDELDAGYDTILGDDGVKLSGGQRQRVAIARALVTDSDFLILDEATSDLDSQLERTIHRRIEQLHGDIGVIVITHRLATVRNADRIYTMESGTVVERGTHQELIAGDTKYAELYNIQHD